jgi:hypothetical protein
MNCCECTPSGDISSLLLFLLLMFILFGSPLAIAIFWNYKDKKRKSKLTPKERFEEYYEDYID